MATRRAATYSASLSVARSYAADIPDAQVIEVEGRSWSPWGEDEDAIVEALEEFLGQVRVIGERAKSEEGLESASKDGSGLWDQSVLQQKYACLS